MFICTTEVTIIIKDHFTLVECSSTYECTHELPIVCQSIVEHSLLRGIWFDFPYHHLHPVQQQADFNKSSVFCQLPEVRPSLMVIRLPSNS